MFKVFRAENPLRIEITWVATGEEGVAMGTKCFIAVGVFSVELIELKLSKLQKHMWIINLHF